MADQNSESTNKAQIISYRDKYLLERDRIRNEIGDLEQIRLSLGISQRRICQLLLVDPSAWTRWNKSEAPPHIYQALRWLLEVKKLNPQVVNPTDLSTRLDFLQLNTKEKIEQLERNVLLLDRQLKFNALNPVQIKLSDREKETEAKWEIQKQEFLEKILFLESRIKALSVRKRGLKKSKKTMNKVGGKKKRKAKATGKKLKSKRPKIQSRPHKKHGKKRTKTRKKR